MATLAYLKTKCLRADGSADCYQTREVPVKTRPLWWHLAGRSYTASGYGARIPTQYMVEVSGKWRRVYCCVYSNLGTLFIGPKYDGSAIVDIFNG